MPRLCMLGQVCRRGWPSSVQHAEKYERGKISMYNKRKYEKGQIPLTSKKCQPWWERSTEDHGAIREWISPRIWVEIGTRPFAGNQKWF